MDNIYDSVVSWVVWVLFMAVLAVVIGLASGLFYSLIVLGWRMARSWLA
jgi:hypothetical protein